jgi:hypothetical protein
MVYQGHGGPPPSSAKGKSGGNAPYSFALYEALPSGKKKKVSLFRVNPGEKNVPFLFLDIAHSSEEAAPSIRIHRDFRYRGSYGNSVICVSYRDSGCPMDKALEQLHRCFDNCPDPCPQKGTKVPVKGGWRWVATGIKLKPFTFSKGTMKGKTVQYQRCLLLVPENQYSTFVAFRETYDELGGLRGKIFNVTREDKQTSSKIGTTWIPAGEMADEEMMEKFEEAASDYGLPVEQYIQPFDYEEILTELSDEEMMRAAKFVARERGVKLDESPDENAQDEDETADTSDAATEEAEEEVPF